MGSNPEQPGALQIDLLVHFNSYRDGSGIFIPPGSSSARKARSVTPVLRMVLVEDA
jgi:hypothetical protein